MKLDNLNWNEMWKQSLNNSSLKWWKDSVGFWNSRADGFRKMPRQDWRAQRVIDNLSIEPEHTILDIGAGSGILSIPFAEYARYVTAIEPSDAMLESLTQRVENEKLKNVSYIQKKWEDIEIDKDFEKHDIVVASYSLAMFDMKEALLKMHNAAQQGVCIFTFAGGIAGSKAYEELWHLIYGEEFKGSPDYIYIYNILYQMGIFANVNVETGLLKRQYSSLEEATEIWQNTLDDYTPDAYEIINEYLGKKLTQDGENLSLLMETGNAMIYWKK